MCRPWFVPVAFGSSSLFSSDALRSVYACFCQAIKPTLALLGHLPHSKAQFCWNHGSQCVSEGLLPVCTRNGKFFHSPSQLWGLLPFGARRRYYVWAPPAGIRTTIDSSECRGAHLAAWIAQCIC